MKVGPEKPRRYLNIGLSRITLNRATLSCGVTVGALRCSSLKRDYSPQW